MSKSTNVIHLPRLGYLLWRARRKNRMIQKNVEKELRLKGIKAHQGFVSYYERGYILDPSEKLLRAFSEIYNLEYWMVVGILVREKYHVRINLVGKEKTRKERVSAEAIHEALFPH